MAQKIIQEQTQKIEQSQRLTQQQMLQVKLIEMSLAELEQSINAELDDNPALETTTDADNANDDFEETDSREDETFEQETERQERQEALDAALEGIGRDDEMPQTFPTGSRTDNENRETVFANSTSFYDTLLQQMGELDLDERQTNIMEYLIGSLDSDGLLRKSPDDLADELAIYQYIDTTPAEIEQLIGMLQTFDPPGIGATSLQMCLLIQIDRLLETAHPHQKLLFKTMREMIGKHFDEWRKKRWDHLARELNLTESQVENIQNEIKKRLNPKPGAALGETQGANLQQIIPDFIVETTLDGQVSFYLNQGNLPNITVSQNFENMLNQYKQAATPLNRKEKEAMTYLKDKVSRAENYMEALKQRRRTLAGTMQAIIEKQADFFRDGDEAELKPMILKDIADKTGYDISTISRVCNQKYAQTKWGTFCLKHFFSDSITTDDGEELSTRKLKVTLRELIENEDKKHPLNDETLAGKMTEMGLPIARRTVAKYREQMGIPVARLRK